MPRMERGRFDDVDIRFVEEPDDEPVRPHSSLRKRMTMALSAWILAAGVLAAGASALSDSGSSGAAAGASASGKASGRTAQGTPFERSGHECRNGKGRRSSSSSGLSPSDF
jgi:hypothetical protein